MPGASGCCCGWCGIGCERKEGVELDLGLHVGLQSIPRTAPFQQTRNFAPPSLRSLPTFPGAFIVAPGSPQITFSQIDKSVLGALPPELRQEVICQVEARKRQRQAGDSHSNASFPSASQGSPGVARLGGGLGHAAAAAFSGGDGGGSSSAVGVPAPYTSLDAAAAEGRAGAAASGGVRATEAVREGFDLIARGGPAKVQQVRDSYCGTRYCFWASGSRRWPVGHRNSAP